MIFHVSSQHTPRGYLVIWLSFCMKLTPSHNKVMLCWQCIGIFFIIVYVIALYNATGQGLWIRKTKTSWCLVLKWLLAKDIISQHTLVTIHWLSKYSQWHQSPPRGSYPKVEIKLVVCIFVNESLRILIIISLNIVSWDPVDSRPALF